MVEEINSVYINELGLGFRRPTNAKDMEKSYRVTNFINKSYR